jgi:hypothetical protein
MATTPVPIPWIAKTHDSGRATDKVYNFVIVGDGFTYQERNKFMDAARAMTDTIRNTAPFFYNQDLFNVWVVNAFSRQSGFDSSPTVDDRDTILNGYRHDGNIITTKRDGIMHARRLITGAQSAANFYGFVFFNAPAHDVAISPSDMSGVPLSYERANSLVPLHEYLHTHMGAGGFALGDHDYRNQPFNTVNKSFDRSFSATGSHAWQHWFVFSGSAPSRLIEVTDAYRSGLISWSNSGQDIRNYHTTHFAYSEDPGSEHYVDALSLFNVGLWESELSDVPDLRASPLYSALRACGMNSLLHHARILCPICSEKIIEHLQMAAGIVDESAGHPFDVMGFRKASGSYLEFQGRNDKVCNDATFPPPIGLDGLVMVNGHTFAPGDISCHAVEYNAFYQVCRVNITNWVTPGVQSTVVFKGSSAPAGDARIWLPGIQLVNGKGARYPVQPQGTALVQKLHEKHTPECDYEYWDVRQGDLTLTFVPQ